MNAVFCIFDPDLGDFFFFLNRGPWPSECREMSNVSFWI